MPDDTTEAREAGKLFLNRGEVVGTLAMWAVRQSPYPVPDGLEAALAAAHEALPDEMEGWFWATEDELRSMISALVTDTPEISRWNEPKSGHGCSIVFSSRYDRPSPDDDFIDLDALAGNVVRTLVADQQEFCDSDGNPEGGDGEAAPSRSDDSAGRNGIAPAASASPPAFMQERGDG